MGAALSLALTFAVFIVVMAAMQYALIVSCANQGRQECWCMFFHCSSMSYPTSANVTAPSLEIGFESGPRDLKFGMIPVGSSGKRYMNIGNDNKSIARFRFMAYGNITPYVGFNPGELVLGRQEKASVAAEFRTYEGMKTGIYTGRIAVLKVEPKYEIMEFMLGWF